MTLIYRAVSHRAVSGGILGALCWLLLASAAHAQPAHAARVPRAVPDSAAADAAVLDTGALARYRPREVSVPASGVEVPLEEANGHPFITVMVNGKGPFRFGLETGGAVTTLTQATANTLGLGAAPRVGAYATIDSIAIGPVRLRHLPVEVVDIGSGLDGFLCLNAYYDLLLTLDGIHHRARFARGALPAPNGRDVLALQEVPGAVQTYVGFELGVGERRTLALLDTQNGTGLYTIPELATDLAFTAPRVRVGVADVSTLGIQPREGARLAQDLRVGDVTFERPIVSIIPMPPVLPQVWNVGWALLRELVVTLDERQHRVRLTRAGPAKRVAAPLALRGTGLRLQPAQNDDKYIVLYVLPESPAAEAGLREDDVIVSFDGLPATSAQLAAWGQRDRAARPVTLVTRHGTDTVTRTVVLTPKVLVP